MLEATETCPDDVMENRGFQMLLYFYNSLPMMIFVVLILFILRLQRSCPFVEFKLFFAYTIRQ